MSDDLRALLIPPQEDRFRTRFGLASAPLRLNTSGWHRLVIEAPDRVYVFPRHSGEVAGVEREAEVLSTVGLAIAPRLLGLHRDERISPYPFLELTRIPGASYDSIDPACAATALEDLSRHVAGWHDAVVPETLRSPPVHREAPRVSGRWIRLEAVGETAAWIAESLAPYQIDRPVDAWQETLSEVAAIPLATVHGELSEGQFLLSPDCRVLGVVDWDALHVGHPLIDFNFGVGGIDMHRANPELKRRMWESYVAGRAVELPDWSVVDRFWCLLDAMTLVITDPEGPRLPGVLSRLAGT